MGTPEEVKSSFQSKDLSTWVLRLLSQVLSVQANDVPSLLINTFGGYSASRGNPEWIKGIEIQIRRLIDRMVSVDLAITEGDKLRLTNLGRACAVSSLSFESALRLVELMRTANITQIPPTNIIAVIQVLEEADAIYTPVMKRGQSESIRLNDVINHQYNTIGLNSIINSWFQKEITKLSADGIPTMHVRHLTIINLDTLIFHQDLLQEKLLVLEDLIEGYQKVTTYDENKKYASVEKRQAAIKNTMIPFSNYINTIVSDKGIARVPKMIREKGFLLFDKK